MSSTKGEPLVEIRFPARPNRLRLVRATISAAAQCAGCTEQCVRDVVIAVDEACQNVIRHAYCGDPDGDIIINMRRVGGHLLIEVRDFAAPVDVERIQPRDLDDIQPGGLGTHFINECMDEAGFEPPPEGTGNLLRMKKRIS